MELKFYVNRFNGALVVETIPNNNPNPDEKPFMPENYKG